MQCCNKKRFSIDATERLLKVGAKISSKLISVVQDALGFDADIFFPAGVGVYGGSDNSVQYPVLPSLSRRVLVSNLITERFNSDKTLDVFNELQPTMWVESEVKIPRYSKVVIKMKDNNVLQLKVQYEAGMMGIDQEVYHKYPLIPMSAVITGAPEITMHPVDLVLDAGADGELKVEARGSGVLGYEWYKGDTKIVGTNTATLKLLDADDTTVGYYRVVVSNSVGSVTSYKAYVTVASLPVIEVHPSGGTFNSGSRCILSVSVSGIPPFTYKWYKDGDLLIGKTTNIISFGSVIASDAGTYTVRVSNLSGGILSNPAVIVIE